MRKLASEMIIEQNKAKQRWFWAFIITLTILFFALGFILGRKA